MCSRSFVLAIHVRLVIPLFLLSTTVSFLSFRGSVYCLINSENKERTAELELSRLQDYKGMRPFLEWRGIKPRFQHSNPLIGTAPTIAMTHHERWDGTGYPRGLKGDKIPLESRIVALSDVYDALCSVRPYKTAYSESESLAIINKEVGKHFDPSVYAALKKSNEELRSIRIQFSDGACPNLGNEEICL